MGGVRWPQQLKRHQGGAVADLDGPGGRYASYAVLRPCNAKRNAQNAGQHWLFLLLLRF
jgi:hypothetical protein